MKYDDASWHYGGDFPDDLPDEAGATHIAMFLAWAVLNGRAGELHLEDSGPELEALRARSMTPVEFFLRMCDGKLTDEDFDEEGNAFAAAYFSRRESPCWLGDYELMVGQDLPSLYHVENSWQTYDLLAPFLDRRFAEWREGRLGREP